MLKLSRKRKKKKRRKLLRELLLPRKLKTATQMPKAKVVKNINKIKDNFIT